MSKKVKNRPPSLLDSKYYQSALKFNQIESNKLEKTTKSLDCENVRNTFLRHQDWENTHIWLLDLHKTSGNADLEKYNKLLKCSEEKNEESVPQYYFMYGMRIGERPQLMKNFLGKSKTKHSQAKHKDEKNVKKFHVLHENEIEIDEQVEKKDADDDDSLSKLNQIVIDGKVITQYPVGYTKSSIRKEKFFLSCSTKQMKKDREEKPLYYLQKHQYVIPPVNMFK